MTTITNIDRMPRAISVPSFTTEGVRYTVTNARQPHAACTCPHYQNRGPVLCKHISFVRRLIALADAMEDE